MRQIKNIDNDIIRDRWDRLADTRYNDIATGKDTSYNSILIPFYEDIVKRSKPRSVLDAGCGVGFLSKIASKYSDRVVGIDISRNSINIAERFNSVENVNYKCCDVCNYEDNLDFDFIISNMVLMDCVDPSYYLSSCHRLMSPGGVIVIVFINPMYWPRYWGYEKRKWFSYKSIIHISANFSTSSSGSTGFDSIHTHRPLSDYINIIINSGFTIKSMLEITGSAIKSKLLAKYPRYVSIVAEK